MQRRVAFTTRCLRGLWFGFRRFRRAVGFLRGRPWGRWDGEAWRGVGPRLFGAWTVVAQDTAGHRLRVRPAQWVDLTSLIGRPEEEPVERVVQSLPAGGIFVDAGAHIGRYSLMAADRVGPSGRVVAVEPSSETWALLKEQAALNGMSSITAIQAALGAADGTAELFGGGDAATNSLHPDWLDRMEGRDPRRKGPGQAVRLVSLSSLLNELQIHHVDLLKIDVEGAELDVLRGAEALLRDGQIRQLVCEVHEPKASRADLEIFLRNCGFAVKDLGNREHLHAVWRPPTQDPARRPLRLGIVGCGLITEIAHIPAASDLDEVRLVGLADTDLARTQTLAGRFGVPRAVARLEDLFGEVDAVILATPPHVRPELAKQAFGHGLHVLCEKPLANSAEECRQMIAAAGAARRTLAVAHTYRFFPNRAYGRALYLKGRLGKLISATIEQGAPYSWHPRTAYTLRKECVPGGVLFNDVHVLDMLLWWFGRPESFTYFDDSLGGLESNVRLTLHYSEGAPVHFRLSRTCSLSNRVEMKFEKGSLCFPLYDMGDLELALEGQPPRRERLWEKSWDFHAAAKAQLRDFVLTAVEGRASMIPGEAGLAVVQLIEDCYRSKADRPRPRETPLPGLTW
jgi:FkbM family methyltransferase